MLLLPAFALGQVSARLQWAHDTLSIGRPAQLNATLRYPEGATLELPEDSELFPGFEILSNQLQSRQTRGGRVEERRTYTLASFRVDSLQTVRLQGRVLLKADTLKLESNRASILLNSALPENTPLDELNYKQQMDLLALEPPFPWAVFLLTFGIITLVLSAAAWFSWPYYLRWRRLKLATQDYQQRLQALHAVPEDDLRAFINQLNATWKAYVSADQPFDLSSLTATELRTREPQLNLSSTDAHAAIELQQAEEDVNYAGLKQLDTDLCRRRARTLLENAYQRRLEAIKPPNDSVPSLTPQAPEYA